MKSCIKWFVENSVAGSLLLIIIVIGGLVGVITINKEVSVTISTNNLEIQVPYLGASPAEVEQRICIPIEEAIHDIDGIEKIDSVSGEGVGVIVVTIDPREDPDRTLDKIKARVDAIDNFPREIESPRYKRLTMDPMALGVVVFGDADDYVLRQQAETIRDDLIALSQTGKVEIESPRELEISVEVSEHDLQKYKLTFTKISNAITASSLDLPAGTIRSEGGDFRLKAEGQAYSSEDLANIVLIRHTDGTQLRLGDIASVKEQFVEQNYVNNFNGKKARYVNVYMGANPNVNETGEAVKRYVNEKSKSLPNDISLAIWLDSTESFSSRMSLLLENGIGGLLLVFVLLLLFLEPALALWISVGIAVSILGTFWLLPYFGVSLNMISLFAFLLMLGIVVDDAIVVGESIFKEREKADGISPAIAATNGADRVSKPVIFAIFSTIITFSPMLLLPGMAAQVIMCIPIVVTLTLLFSLIDSLFILPSHLARYEFAPKKATTKFSRVQKRIANSLGSFANNQYRHFIVKAIRNRVLVLVSFVMFFAITVSLVMGSWVPQSMLPNIVQDYMMANVKLAEGVPFKTSEENLARIVHAAYELKVGEEEDIPVVKNIQSKAVGNQLTVIVELNKPYENNIDLDLASRQWEEGMGRIIGLEDLNIDYTFTGQGNTLSYELSAIDDAALVEGTNSIKNLLSQTPGIYSVEDDTEGRHTEIALSLKPEAENLSISLADIAQQIRYGFYGAQAQKILRGRDEIKVMVRYTSEERRSLDHFDSIFIKTNTGHKIPLSSVADVRYISAPSTIKRTNRGRSVAVTAKFDASQVDISTVNNTIFKELLPKLRKQHPSLLITIGGVQQELSKTYQSAINYTLLALLIVYALIAVSFGSYWHPLIIISAVPFGFTGAVWGHLIFDLEISFYSLLGVMAAAGVVVNDNLVLIDGVNRLNKSGMKNSEAIIEGAVDRFRPIMLTSMTTFVGLLPLMFETSVQAQFLIPMVVAIAFGVLFATLVTLIWVPCLLSFSRKKSSKKSSSDEVESPSLITAQNQELEI